MSVLREIKRVRLSEDLMFEPRTKKEKDPVIWENKFLSGRRRPLHQESLVSSRP